MTIKYKVWNCKLVVPDKEFPHPGFDLPPRQALQKVMDQHGIEVVALFSGWDGTLSENELSCIESEDKDGA